MIDFEEELKKIQTKPGSRRGRGSYLQSGLNGYDRHFKRNDERSKTTVEFVK